MDDTNNQKKQTVEALSYRILSQIDPEEESKDEKNDPQIFRAVVASVAAYQIRRLQRKLRK